MTVPRPKPSSIPDEPGAYLFRDADERVVYVGKARVAAQAPGCRTGAGRCTRGRRR